MTEEVLQAVEAFRRRPLPEEMAFVYLDGLYLKLLREGEGVVREVVYVALGVTPSGERRVLGYWLLPAESALGWEGVLGELWQRGLRRVLLFITDGLPGLPEAIRRVYPQAEWQRCVVHGVRWSLGQVRARDRTLLAEDLRRVYGAESRGEALEALEALREAWGSRYPGVVALWAGDSGAFLRFYGYPKVLWPYLRSTNLMERFIREIRRGTKVRDHKFPGEEAVYKLLYLGHGRQPVSWVGEARREVGGAKAQGVLGGEGDAREDASGAVCPPYTNAYTYILTRPGQLQRPAPPGGELLLQALGYPGDRVLTDAHPGQALRDGRYLAGGDPLQVHLQHRFLHLPGHPLVPLKDLGQESPLPVPGYPELGDPARRRDEVPGVVAVPLPAAAWGALTVTRSQVLGHLFFQHLLDDGLDPFPDAPADLLLGQPLELLSVHSALHA
jgi:hypothetical protein